MFVKIMGKKVVALLILLGFISTLCILCEPLILKRLFTLEHAQGIQQVWSFILYGLCVYLLLYALMLADNLLSNYYMVYRTGELRVKLYQLLTTRKHAYTEDEQIAILTQDVEFFFQQYMTMALLVLVRIQFIIVLSAYLLYQNIIVGALFIVCATLSIFVRHAFDKKIDESGGKQSTTRSTLLSKIMDAMNGQQTLRMNQALDAAFSQVNDATVAYENARKKASIIRKGAQFVLGLVGFIAQVLPLFIGFYLQSLGVSGVTMASLVAMFVASRSFGTSIGEAIDCYNQLRASNSVKDKFVEIFALEETPLIVHETSSAQLSELAVEGLAKSFGERTLFTHFSHVFERGKKYLLTGPSGCGKSTFFAMLLGDETLDEGQIIFREKNGQTVDNFAANIGLISQSPHLFNRTIRYNLALGSDFTDEQMLKALDQVGLTSEFTDILDVKIENNGENISGGQKIRLEIARSLLRQKEVLLVDEATASLDPENAKKVHELILSLPLTIIEIAHHIDQKAHYDQIIALK